MTEEGRKFVRWMALKKNLKNITNFAIFKEGEVWWTSVGDNVGIEINGKSNLFTRPVLVYKKFSNHGFLGIPLTSQRHSGSWYQHFILQGKDSYAVLSQIRTFSAARLQSRIAQIPSNDLSLIEAGLLKLYFPKNFP